jgi:uncharacterized protein with von Willebrand factor type A (vWA) domain
MNTNDSFRLLGAMPCKRVFTALCELVDGISVTDAVARRFQSDKNGSDHRIFDTLHSVGFVEHHTEWTEQISRYLAQQETITTAEDELPKLERRLKTLDVQVRHAADQRTRNRLLKSKTTKWEEDSKQSELAKQYSTLLDQRGRVMGAIKSGERTYDELKFLVSRDGHDPPYIWAAGVARRMTNHGYFLLSSLQRIPSDHYAGREVSDVLALGGILI